MKILYIITQAEAGGAQKSVLLLAHHFQGEIAAGSGKTFLFEEAAKEHIPTHRLRFLTRGISPVYDTLSLFEIFFMVRRLKPSIVHLNSSKAGFIGSIAGKLAGAKVVFSARGFVFNEPRPKLINLFYLWLEKFASLFRDQIVTVSLADEQAARKFHIIDPKKLITIHNAIDSVNFVDRASVHSFFGLNPSKTNIITIANFYPAKGLDVLIRAIALLPPDVRASTHLTIIGDGPQRAQLESLLAEFNLSGYVRLAGQIHKASQYLKGFDLFVLPSRKEGFPLTLLEAMQAGLPIIATRVGGNAEALGDAGVYVHSGNPELLSSQISRLVLDNGLVHSQAEKSRQRSVQFTLEKMFTQFQQTYQDLENNSS